MKKRVQINAENYILELLICFQLPIICCTPYFMWNNKKILHIYPLALFRDWSTIQPLQSIPPTFSGSLGD